MPIIRLTFGKICINCLFDCGSDTSIIKPGVFPYKMIKLTNCILDIAGTNQVNYKIISPIPVEFLRKGTMEGKVFEIKSKKYEAIIGMNFLILLQAKINIVS